MFWLIVGTMVCLGFGMFQFGWIARDRADRKPAARPTGTVIRLVRPQPGVYDWARDDDQ